MRRFFSAALVFCLLMRPVLAVVVFDANATAPCLSGTGVTTMTCTNLTVGSGSNRALVCQFVWDGDPGAINAANVKWDNLGTPQQLALIVNATGTNTVHGELWGLVAPTSGAKQLSITWTTARQIDINCLSYTGVDQTGGTTTFPHGAAATGAASPTTVTVTSAVGNAVVAAHTMTAGTVTATSGTNTFIDNTPTNMSTAGNRDVGAASVALTSTVTGGPPTWVAVGADILASTGGAVVPKRSLLGVGTH